MQGYSACQANGLGKTGRNMIAVEVEDFWLSEGVLVSLLHF